MLKRVGDRILLLILIFAASAFCSNTPLSPILSYEYQLEHRFGIEIEASNVPFVQKLTGMPCTDEDTKKKALEVLKSVLSPYPPSLSRIAKLKTIYICSDLFSFVTSVAGVTASSDDSSAIYLNASFLNSPDYLTRSLHHEIFHAIEFAHPFDNELWRSINPYEPYLEDITPAGQVVYYAGGSAPPFEPGFVSEYARVRPREDRAELFAHLMQPRLLTESETAMLAGDPFLQKKISNLSSTLDSLFGRTDNLWDLHAVQYAQSQFTTQQLYTAKSGVVVHSGPNENYPIVSAVNPLQYTGLFHAEKGDRLLILLDKSGQRVYVHENELLLINESARQSSMKNAPICP